MSLKLELKRKALHMTGLSVPLIYLALGKSAAITFVLIFLIIFLALEPFRLGEGLRIKVKEKLGIPEEVTEKIEREIDGIAREREKRGIGAHIYFTIAALLVIYLFPREVAIGSISVATLGDAMAAIIGKSYGRHRFKKWKKRRRKLSILYNGSANINPSSRIENGPLSFPSWNDSRVLWPTS